MKETECVCRNCKKPFLAKRSDTKYCCGACRQDAYLQRYASFEKKEKQKLLEVEKANSVLLGLVEQIENFHSIGFVSKNEAENFLTKIEGEKYSFLNLPIHLRILNVIKTICFSFLKAIEKNKSTFVETKEIEPRIEERLDALTPILRELFNEQEKLKQTIDNF
jgi:hypothetical protein